MAHGRQAYVRLIQPAVADLERLLRLDPQIVRWALKKMLLLERDPNAGEPLLGTPLRWRKLVGGNRHWRIVWRVTVDETGAAVVDVAEVWAVGARADAEIYGEMRRRIADLGPRPAAHALTEVVGRLGGIGRAVAAAAEPLNDPVPTWLAGRLSRQVGLAPEVIASMTGEQAMHVWEEHITRPR